MTAGAGPIAASPARPTRTRRAQRDTSPGRLGVLLAAIALLFLGLPVAVLVVRAFLSGTLVAEAGDKAVLDALVLSMVTTLISLSVTVIFGIPLALLLARRQFRGKWLAETLVDLPIVLPPSVAGLALLLAFGRRGALGPTFEGLGISIAFSTVAVIMAQIFVSAPFFVRSARAGFASVDPDVEEAAAVDGASHSRIMRSVTVPLAAPALGAGLVLAWARALGEFGATIMFAGNIGGRTQTLPLLVYSEYQSSLDQAVAAAAILVLAAFSILVAVRLTDWRAALDVRLVN